MSLSAKVTINVAYTRLEGIALTCGATSTDVMEVTAADCELGYCYIASTYSGSSWRWVLFNNNVDLKIYNSIAYHYSSNSSSAAIASYVGGTIYASNVTALNNSSGSGHVFLNYSSGSTLICYNCLADSGASGNDFQADAGTLTMTYCGSSDTSATGTGAVTNGTWNFVDSANNDYHITSNSSSAYNAGNSGDPNFSFTDDIDGDTRHHWDMGADFIATISAGGDIRNHIIPAYMRLNG